MPTTRKQTTSCSASQVEETPPRKVGTKTKPKGPPEGVPDPKGHKIEDSSDCESDLAHQGSLDAILSKLSALDVLNAKISDISSQLDAVKSEVQHVRSGFEVMENRVVEKCTKKVNDALATYDKEVTSQLAERVNKISQQMDEDRARLTAVLHGIPSSAHRKAVESWLKGFKVAFRSLRTFTGKNEKTTGIVSFADPASRDSFLAKAKSEMQPIVVDGQTYKLSVSPGKTKLQRDRNAEMKSRFDQLQKRAGPGQTYTLDWKTRCILLNGNVHLKQLRHAIELSEPDLE